MAENVAIAAILLGIFVVGLVGNGTVIVVFLRSRETWTVTTTYLFNLAVTDALFVCNLPLWSVYYLNNYDWPFGSFLCKMAGTLTSVNLYGTVYLLTAISIVRRQAVVHAATRVRSILTKKWTRRICVAIWILAFLLSLPDVLFRQVRDIHVTNSSTNAANVTIYPRKCSVYIPHDVTGKKLKMAAIKLVRVMMGFIVPGAVICTCYVQLVVTLRRNMIARNRRQVKRRVAKVTGIIIVAFVICWLPVQIMTFYSATVGWLGLFTPDPAFYRKYYPYAICLAYANSDVNPFVYALTSSNVQGKSSLTVRSKRGRLWRRQITNNSLIKTQKHFYHHISQQSYGGQRLAIQQTSQQRRCYVTVWV